MSSYTFFGNNFKEFCEENNLSEGEGFKFVLEEINKLSKEKETILEERREHDDKYRFHSKC